jgi:hypothetical protein
MNTQVKFKRLLKDADEWWDENRGLIALIIVLAVLGSLFIRGMLFLCSSIFLAKRIK